MVSQHIQTTHVHFRLEYPASRGKSGQCEWPIQLVRGWVSVVRRREGETGTETGREREREREVQRKPREPTAANAVGPVLKGSLRPGLASNGRGKSWMGQVQQHTRPGYASIHNPCASTATNPLLSVGQPREPILFVNTGLEELWLILHKL